MYIDVAYLTGEGICCMVHQVYIFSSSHYFSLINSLIGTGKTSVILSIAGIFELSVCILVLSSGIMTDIKLSGLIKVMTM